MGLVVVGLAVALVGAVALLGRQLRLNRAIAKSEERHRVLVQTAGDLLWQMDAEGRMVFVNSAARGVFLIEPEAMVGRRISEFLAPVRLEEAEEYFGAILRGEDRGGFEILGLRDDGSTVPLLVHSTALRDPRGGRVIGATGTASDLSEIHAMRDAMLHRERLQALGTLAGGIAHDFNNLLTAIQGETELAQRNPEKASRHLDNVLSTTRSVSRLTKQLLVFARHQQVKKTVIDLAEVASGLHEMLDRLIGSAIELRVHLPAHAVRVRADLAQLEQVVVNLVLNARDAMPDGGRIVLAVERRAIRADEADGEPELRPGDYAVLTVSDTGAGMDEETLRRATEPFFTTKGPGAGSGLGLATVHGVAVRHEGALFIRSEPGEGTVIEVLLPCTEREVIPEPEPVTTSGAIIGKVLLVEDDELVRETVAAMLTQAGLELQTTDCAEGALALDPGGFDVLITDVRMPGRSGPQLAHELRVRRPGLPVLFISGYADEALGAGEPRTAFLAKPFSAAELEAAVTGLLEESRCPTS